jgi:hypothetical protein
MMEGSCEYNTEFCRRRLICVAEKSWEFQEGIYSLELLICILYFNDDISTKDTDSVKWLGKILTSSNYGPGRLKRWFNSFRYLLGGTERQYSRPPGSTACDSTCNESIQYHPAPVRIVHSSHMITFFQRSDSLHPFKSAFLLNNTRISSSYLTGNISRLRYRDQPVNAGRFLWEPCQTHKPTLWAESRVLMC